MCLLRVLVLNIIVHAMQTGQWMEKHTRVSDTHAYEAREGTITMCSTLFLTNACRSSIHGEAHVRTSCGTGRDCGSNDREAQARQRDSEHAWKHHSKNEYRRHRQTIEHPEEKEGTHPPIMRGCQIKSASDRTRGAQNLH